MDRNDSNSGSNTQAFGNEQRLLAGRYELLEKIGEGGAAEVFRARDERLGRIVAIKLLRPQYTMDPQSRNRFAIEARAAARLSHSNIVDVYDFGEAPDGAMFIAMQYIEGGNLKDVLRKRGRLSPGETITIAVQVCRALSMAHAEGLIHRDVKPQNIMVDRAGDVRLTDFGVVKALSGPALTQSGMTFGTAAYLSPEQATGATIGPASDLYALGCVMYELLAGTPPFSGDNPAVVAYKQVWEQPNPLHNLAPEVPPSLEAVIMRCLNKDPDGRYPSAAALAAELERVSGAFNQPTQVVPLTVVANASAGAGTRPQANAHMSQAEKSQPVPIAVSPNTRRPAPVPPVRTQATGTPPPQPTLSTGGYQGAVSAPVSTLYAKPQRRSLGWMPFAVVVLLVGLGLCGFGAMQGGILSGFGIGGAQPETTPTQVGGGVQVPPADTPTPRPQRPTPTALSTVVVATDTPMAPPTDTPTTVPIDTPAPAPTDTPVPTDTPEPAPTDTPLPEPLPTDTPLPPPTEPPPPVPPEGNMVTLDDTAFSGGYTRRDGRYHGRTAHWVYGQGTAYHTMVAQFVLDKVPKKEVKLVITGVDSEDERKTPMLIAINSTPIFNDLDPLPNDDQSGVEGEGNWGKSTFYFDPDLLHEGVNSLIIANLDPSDQINSPPFIMVDYATLTWDK
jgi:serine/threonine protein kinase